VRLDDLLALLEATLDATHDGILVLGLDRQIVRSNGPFNRMFGIGADEIASHGLNAVVNALASRVEDIDAVRVAFDTIWSNPDVEVLDLIRFKDGRVFECFVAPYRVEGRILGRVASFREITHWVQTEQALEVHRGFLEKAQEVAHIGSWVAELDGTDRLGWSVEAHRIFRVPLGAFEGTSESFFARVHPDDRDNVRLASEAAIAGGPYDIEHRILLPDGVVRWVHERADIVRDSQGRAVRMIGTVQDITEHRLLEEQLRQSQKMEAIGRLAGGIAHDLNNALTAIAGYAELALGELSSRHVARADVEEIRRAAERAGSVTRQLLAFSRKQLLEPRLFDVNATLASLGRLLSRLLGTDIEVRTDLTAALPSILGDPGQIEQAVVNLAVNARDAMPRGGRLTLTTSIETVDEAFSRAHPPMPPGAYVVLRVGDTGCGMSKETQTRVFEPFFTTKELGKGTGLGLSMVYGTMKQIGGFIFVESVQSLGTTFSLYFQPASAEQPVRVARESTAKTIRGQEVLLVVEDEPAVRNLVASSLRNDGYRLLLAGSAEEALEIEAAHDDAIDLLLTDAIMPGKSGVELAGLLAVKRPGLRVIVMSGYTEDTLNGLDARIELLQKPFAPRDLRRRIREALDQPREISR
jgi:PAS domain S-box-containing protein